MHNIDVEVLRKYKHIYSAFKTLMHVMLRYSVKYLYDLNFLFHQNTTEIIHNKSIPLYTQRDLIDYVI